MASKIHSRRKLEIVAEPGQIGVLMPGADIQRDVLPTAPKKAHYSQGLRSVTTEQSRRYWVIYVVVLMGDTSSAEILKFQELFALASEIYYISTMFNIVLGLKSGKILCVTVFFSFKGIRR